MIMRILLMFVLFLGIGVLRSYAVNSQHNTSIHTYNMLELCGQTLYMKWKSIYTAAITFNFNPEEQPTFSHHAVRKEDEYSVPVMCELSIESWSFLDRLMIVFNELKLRTDCDDTYLEILDGPGPDSPPVKGLPPSLCKHHRDRVLSTPYQTSDKHLTIRVHGNPGRKHSLQFNITVVAFHEGNCRSYEYTCASGRCIMDDLVCNGHNPCGDHSDCLAIDDSAREVNTDENGVLVAALVAISITIAAALAGIVIFCQCYRRRRKHLRQQQYLSAYGRTRNDVNISVSPSSQLERSESQIEAERRLAPPSYSTLPTTHSGQSQQPTENQEPSLEECLEADESNPPSYACVMSHMDEFSRSDLSLSKAGKT